MKNVDDSWEKLEEGEKQTKVLLTLLFSLADLFDNNFTSNFLFFLINISAYILFYLIEGFLLIISICLQKTLKITFLFSS